MTLIAVLSSLTYPTTTGAPTVTTAPVVNASGTTPSIRTTDSPGNVVRSGKVNVAGFPA